MKVGMNGDKYGFMDGGMNVYRKRLMNGNREGWMERGIYIWRQNGICVYI